MRTLQHLPESKQQRISSETLEIYAPIANRLGIGWVRTELEDLSFKAMMSDLYNDLVMKVAKRKEEQEEYVKEVTSIVNGKPKDEGICFLRVHPLRAADALQLAAAFVAAERRPSTLAFVTLDDRLRAAAGKEGFVIDDLSASS